MGVEGDESVDCWIRGFDAGEEGGNNGATSREVTEEGGVNTLNGGFTRIEGLNVRGFEERDDRDAEDRYGETL